MNYEKMIEILEAVKEMRASGTNLSSYVCDIVNSEVSDFDIDRSAKSAITEDIADRINHHFGVPGYLNSVGDDTDPEDFRTTMIDGLIAKYTEAQNALV